MIAAAVSGVVLLAVIFVLLALANLDRVRAAWRDVTRPLP